MARTTKKTTIRPAKKRKNPSFRRRRRSDSLRELGSTVTGAAARAGTGALYGTSAATGSTTALIGATARTGSGVTAGVAGTETSTGGFVSAATGLIGALAEGPAPVSSCSFALAGLIGAVTTEGAGRFS
jgi:hypothetical protein